MEKDCKVIPPMLNVETPCGSDHWSPLPQGMYWEHAILLHHIMQVPLLWNRNFLEYASLYIGFIRPLSVALSKQAAH